MSKSKANNLVIVESPTKGKTIERFLGPGFTVTASYGHVRDLPKSQLGVDETTFVPKYVIPPKARKVIRELKEMIKKADAVYIATDLDREGEAIGWHISEATGLTGDTKKPIRRIVFHEITKKALEDALKHPRALNLHLVDAQQARRVLDRLVGYKLSPLLWKKVAKGLSAGRVQSVALRLIVDREREIQQFKPDEYWSVEAELEKEVQRFIGELVGKDGKPLEKLAIKSEKDALAIITDLENAPFRVADIKDEQTSRWPFPPLTTSTMQQEAARELGWSASQTMRTAQSLYEQGFITYHRTDSVNLAWSAIGQARKVIESTYGRPYLPEKPRQYKTKSKGAQEAHEAIRPTYPDRTPAEVKLTDREEQRLYELIWRRMIASQMTPAVIATRTVDIRAKSYLFRATGSRVTFDGFTKVWPVKMEEKEVPSLTIDDTLVLIALTKTQHFTEPPPRFNMASLIKTLEEHGIGRPSTYAPIISTIVERNYVTTSRGVFFPTDLGTVVTDLLVEHFPEIVDVSFTAKMEGDLDDIAAGTDDWKTIIRNFYGPFSKRLSKKQDEIQKADLEEQLDERCPESGHPLIIKYGRYGKFIACSGFPECKYTRPFVVELDLTCPKCGQGKVVERKTRKGRTFWGCSRYPDCDWASWTRPAMAGNQQSTINNRQ